MFYTFSPYAAVATTYRNKLACLTLDSNQIELVLFSSFRTP
jgi:hypothetical protein